MRRLSLVICWSLVIFTSSVLAADSAQPKVGNTGPELKNQSDWVDPAYDTYVNSELLRTALMDRNAPQLLDVALQFVQAEKILLRPHRAVSSEKVLRMAFTLARDVGDKETLARLEQSLAALPYPKLKAEVAVAKKLAAGSRSISTSELPKSVLEKNATYIYEYLEFQGQIEAAEVIGDRKRIDQLAKQITENQLLTKEDKAALTKKAAVAREKAVPDVQTIALAKLTGGARNISQFDWMTPAEKQIERLINQERRNKQLLPLRVDPMLTIAARVHSISQSRQSANTTIQNTRASLSQIQAMGLQPQFWQECVNTSSNAHNALHEDSYGWMKKDQEKAKILNPSLTNMGIGVVVGKLNGQSGYYYFTIILSNQTTGQANRDRAGSLITRSPSGQSYLLKDVRGKFSAKLVSANNQLAIQPPPLPPVVVSKSYVFRYADATDGLVTFKFTITNTNELTYSRTRTNGPGTSGKTFLTRTQNGYQGTVVYHSQAYPISFQTLANGTLQFNIGYGWYSLQPDRP